MIKIDENPEIPDRQLTAATRDINRGYYAWLKRRGLTDPGVAEIARRSEVQRQRNTKKRKVAADA